MLTDSRADLPAFASCSLSATGCASSVARLSYPALAVGS